MKNIQNEMQTMLEQAVSEGKERGVQLAVYHKGELIVNAYAGTMSSDSTRAVTPTTLFPVFSVTKGITATVIHLLAEQGKLDYDQRICELWPEFGVNGKEGITIRHALTHTSGIAQLPEGIDFADMNDWDKMCKAIALLTPMTIPGEVEEYHAITYGWIVGEIARRADGRPFAQIVKEDICAPLGIEDLYVGIPPEKEPQVAFLEEPEQEGKDLSGQGTPAIPAWVLPLHSWMNHSDARRACIPATNGIMSALALSRHYAALLPGGVDGVQLLSPACTKLAAELAVLPDGSLITRGLGYIAAGHSETLGDVPGVFGSIGYGGSYGFADPENKLAVGFTKNMFSNSDIGVSVVKKLRSLL